MRKTEEIQRELAVDRAVFAATINQLNDRLSMDALADEAGHQVADLSDTLVQSMASHLRGGSKTASLTASLVGLGVDWLRDQRQSSAAAQPEADSLRATAEEMRARIADGTEALSGAARARVIAARERAVSALEQAALDEVDQRDAQVEDRAEDRAEDQPRAPLAKHVLQEHPVALGGAALALGAAAAGALLWARRSDQRAPRTDARPEQSALFAEADRLLNEEMQTHRQAFASKKRA